jgi:hypothetical protein
MQFLKLQRQNYQARVGLDPLSLVKGDEDVALGDL